MGIIAAGDLDARITAAFEDIPVQEAIRRLAEGHAAVWVVAEAPGPDRPGAAERSPGTGAGPTELIQALALPRGDPRSVEALSRVLTQAEDSGQRARAALELGRIGQPGAATALRQALADEHFSVRIQALYAIRQSEGARAVPVFEQALQDDPDPRVRLAAVRALSVVPPAAAAAALALAGRDPDPAVRREAMRALGASPAPPR